MADQRWMIAHGCSTIILFIIQRHFMSEMCIFFGVIVFFVTLFALLELSNKRYREELHQKINEEHPELSGEELIDAVEEEEFDNFKKWYGYPCLREKEKRFRQWEKMSRK